MPKFDEHILNSKRYQELRATEEEDLVRSLSKQYGYTYVNLRGVSINPAALVLISEEAARSALVVAFEKQNKLISIAIHNPNHPGTEQIIDELQAKWKLSIYMCSTASLEHAWKRYADQRATIAVRKGVLDIDPKEIARLSKSVRTPEEIKARILEIKTLNPARRISSTLEVLFGGALSLRASDIHIEPEVATVRVRYRLDGVLHNMVDLDMDVYERLISRIKLLAGLILNIKDRAQDGRFTFDNGEKEIEVRTSIIPGSAGESAVMRLLDPSVASFNLELLGLNPIMSRVMAEELKRPNGMILTTGPTGSGKTTALYAFLRTVHTPEVKIITIEDPVEYKVDGIVQTQVEEDYTFESGLRSILRQDPDIIMVGEIRDREVAETAVHAAETGHLVFSTLHTNSAAGAFPRLIDLGVDSRMIGTAANIILGQRLVRQICKDCKKEREATPEEKATILRVMAGHPNPPPLGESITIFEGGGCEQCAGTGFKGRQGIFEAIKVDKAVEEVVIRDPREHVILEAAKPQGIPTMAEDGIEKVLAGITSLAELERVVDLNRLRS
ncbi:MAG: GspE/PulE family protein [Candidatus Paceibacterota bacterium]